MEAIREVSILDEGGVRITDKRVILGSETYTLENISSVTMTYSDNQGGMLPILIAVAGSSIGFCALFFPSGRMVCAGDYSLPVASSPSRR